MKFILFLFLNYFLRVAAATIYGWDDAIGINRIPSFSIEIKVELFSLGVFSFLLNFYDFIECCSC
jgi:hypothetical protein